MVAAPKFTPVTWGWVAGAVNPWAMKTLVGAMDTLERSVLESVMFTPPAGAGVPNVIGNEAD